MTRALFFTLSILLITMIFTYQTTTQLPPPDSPLALAVQNPLDHLRKTIVIPQNNTIQVAPHSPLIIYISRNISTTIVINSQQRFELNGTGNWTVLVGDLGEGRFYTIWVSSWNATITLYVLSTPEEATLAQRSQPPSLDPSWVKRVRAVTAALVAVLAGVPLGYRIKRKVVERKAKRVPREEL